MTDDPLFDYYRHMDEQEEALERLPICEYCEERIQDEFSNLSMMRSRADAASMKNLERKLRIYAN